MERPYKNIWRSNTKNRIAINTGGGHHFCQNCGQDFLGRRIPRSPVEEPREYVKKLNIIVHN